MEALRLVIAVAGLKYTDLIMLISTMLMRLKL